MKLVDFGSCVLWDVSKPAPLQTGRELLMPYLSSLDDVVLTCALPRSGFYGTSTFAAPEIFLERPYDGSAAEVWALGVILSLLLTGAHPFANSEDARYGFLAPSKVPISPLAFDCLRRCLTVDVNRRIQLHELLQHPWILACAAI